MACTLPSVVSRQDGLPLGSNRCSRLLKWPVKIDPSVASAIDTTPEGVGLT